MPIILKKSGPVAPPPPEEAPKKKKKKPKAVEEPTPEVDSPPPEGGHLQDRVNETAHQPPPHPKEREASLSVTMEQEVRHLPVIDEDRRLRVTEALSKTKKLTNISCDACHMAAECPEYKPEHVCAFEEVFDAIELRDEVAAMGVIEEVVTGTVKRYRRALMSEALVNQGALNSDVTRLGDTALKQLQMLMEMRNQRSRVSLTVQGPANETTKSMAGGALSRLFGAAPVESDTLQLNEPRKDTVTITAEVEPVPPKKESLRDFYEDPDDIE